jgi:hypothetical protein
LFTPVPFGTPLAMHIHPVLHMFIDGQPEIIPANVGVGPDSAFPLHTHDTTGTIHVESPVLRTFYLQDFFAIWNLYPQGSSVLNQLGGARALTLTVNGVSTVGLSPVVLHDHDNIVIQALSPTPDAVTAANEAFVTAMYRDLLHRDVDTLGLVLFTTAIDQGLPRTSAAQMLESSGEYQSLVVEQLYNSILHRGADPVGLAAFTGFLAAGGTAEQVESMLLGSDEYYRLSGATNGSFLSVLYSDVLHRGIDSTGAAAWGSELATGATRTTVAAQVLSSGEAEDLQIQVLYVEFLHRPADGPGLAGFSTAMQEGMSEEQILATIVGSEEYFARQHS